MNHPTSDHENAPPDAGREEVLSALFANMVIQQTNTGMMLLGKVPHPETGEFLREVESARMFIDQLEMIEVKTKGNLSKEEDALLRQALTALRMTYVEAVDEPAIKSPRAETGPPPPGPAGWGPTRAASPTPPPAAETPASGDESRKKFSKKY